MDKDDLKLPAKVLIIDVDKKVEENSEFVETDQIINGQNTQPKKAIWRRQVFLKSAGINWLFQHPNARTKSLNESTKFCDSSIKR